MPSENEEPAQAKKPDSRHALNGLDEVIPQLQRPPTKENKPSNSWVKKIIRPTSGPEIDSNLVEGRDYKVGTQDLWNQNLCLQTTSPSSSLVFNNASSTPTGSALCIYPCRRARREARSQVFTRPEGCLPPFDRQ